MTTHAELELTLRASEGGIAADLRFHAPGSAADSDLALGVPVALDLAGLLALSDDWAAYGRALTSQLFADSRMRVAWASVSGFLQGANARLRVRLRIDPGADELHSLRWELLQDPATSQSLCRSERLLLSRYLDTAAMGPLLAPARADLRALVAVANPTDLAKHNLAPVDVAGELARARAALGDLPATLLAGPPHGPGATLEGLADALRAGQPLLVLVCHASMVAGRPILWLEQDDRSSDRVPGEMLVQRIADLDQARRPLLIILAACQTAGRDQNADVLAALGPQLARAGVGAVIGMQGNVPMATVELLLPRLLARLREDGQIDRALALARAALPADQPWWMPALFMRVRDGRLWAAAPPPDAMLEPAPPGPTRPPRDPRAREELVRFRAIFSLALDQIDLLNSYKELHDTLQRLEVPFNTFTREQRKRLIDTPAAWGDIDAPIADLQDYTGAALAIMSDPRLANEWGRGIQNLQGASADLALAQAQADVARLDRAVARYERVLALELPSADNRLATCAGSLHLAQLTEALGAVQTALSSDAASPVIQRELAGLIVTFHGLRAQLDALVPEHRGWQDVDSDLRWVDAELNKSPSGSPAALGLAWDDLQQKTTQLVRGATERWAAELSALSEQIGQALVAGSIAIAQRHFVSYKRRATRRFIDVDKALLAACAKLREAGKELALVLRMLDDQIGLAQAIGGGAGGAPPAVGEAEGLREQLAKHRSTLGTYLGQIAIAGSANARPEVMYGISEARQKIRRIKDRLRALGQAVADEMDDDE